MPAGHSLAIISAIRPLRLGIRTQSVRPLSSIVFLIFASTPLAHRTRLSVTRRARELLGAQRKNMARVEFLLVLLRVFKYCGVTAQRELPSVCRIHQPKQMLIFGLVTPTLRATVKTLLIASVLFTTCLTKGQRYLRSVRQRCYGYSWCIHFRRANPFLLSSRLHRYYSTLPPPPLYPRQLELSNIPEFPDFHRLCLTRSLYDRCLSNRHRSKQK